MSMPNCFLGRSRTCPLLARTSKSGPRYLLIVFALAGDSTMTRFFFFRVVATGGSSCWRSSQAGGGEHCHLGGSGREGVPRGDAPWRRGAAVHAPGRCSRQERRPAKASVTDEAP